jgi:hypothetical protein
MTTAEQGQRAGGWWCTCRCPHCGVIFRATNAASEADARNIALRWKEEHLLRYHRDRVVP